MTSVGSERRQTDAARFAENIWRLLAELEVEYTVEYGRPAIHTYGQAHSCDEGGEYEWRGWDSLGQPMLGMVKYDDSQAVQEFGTKSRPEATLTSASDQALARRDCAGVARLSDAKVDERAEAVREWLARDEHAASAFIADELCRTDLPGEWRDAVVFVAEDASFPTRELQQRACGALRETALRLRTTSQPGIERVVWSALRRFGSLVEPQSVDQFRDFLNPVGYVDTRLLALRSIIGVFERQPPDTPGSLTDLAGRTFEIAEKLLDPDVFASGEISAIATQAVLVLCVLGDRRALQCANRAKLLGRRWVIRKLRERLQEIRAAWTDESHAAQDHPAYTLVQQILTDLE